VDVTDSLRLEKEGRPFARKYSTRRTYCITSSSTKYGYVTCTVHFLHSQLVQSTVHSLRSSNHLSNRQSKLTYSIYLPVHYWRTRHLNPLTEQTKITSSHQKDKQTLGGNVKERKKYCPPSLNSVYFTVC